MAIDTTQLGEVEYPGEEGVGTPPRPPRPWRRSEWLRPNIHLGGRRGRRRLPLRPLARQRHRQWLPADRWRLGGERRRHRPRARVGGRGLDGRHRGLHLPGGQDPRLRALPGTAPEELGALLQDDRRPQGGRLAVRGRRPHLPLHRWPAGHAHPHRAPEPDQPRLRARRLHRHRERARHDHDDDGVVRRRRATRELAHPSDDRLPADGLPPRGGILVLDFHGGISRHRERVVLRRLPDRVDRVRAVADAGRAAAWMRTWSDSR